MDLCLSFIYWKAQVPWEKVIPYVAHPNHVYVHRADSRLAPRQWETLLYSITVSHWLGVNENQTGILKYPSWCIHSGFPIDMIEEKTLLLWNTPVCIYICEQFQIYAFLFASLFFCVFARWIKKMPLMFNKWKKTLRWAHSWHDCILPKSTSDIVNHWRDSYFRMEIIYSQCRSKGLSPR